jgi:hypothetical protein
MTFEEWAESCGLTIQDHYHIYVYSRQAWSACEAQLKPDADLCKKIIDELVKRNNGMTPSWLLDLPEPPK